ncbi:MAG TPA: M23 family metallopeptidase [Anaerolineales bacterium]
MSTPRNHTLLSILILSLVLILAVAACSAAPNPGLPTGQPTAAGTTSQAAAKPTTQPVEPATAAPAEATSAAAPPAAAPPKTEPTQAAPAAQTGPCEKESCVSDGLFLLQSPVGGSGRNTIQLTNRFGKYSANLKGGYHGVSFLNSTGTPVVASADGEVVTAGDDTVTPYGPYKNLYGNLVILKHNLPGYSDPVFTVYGHLSEIEVKVKDSVKAGQEIGKVGMSGSVKGSALSFEVRLGENSYLNASNPELWLKPTSEDNGAFAGRIVDAKGDLVSMPNLTVQRLAGPGLPAIETFYLSTYAESKISGQKPWGENFAAGDLPAGSYKISFWLNGIQNYVVEVQGGKLTLLTFKVP